MFQSLLLALACSSASPTNGSHLPVRLGSSTTFTSSGLSEVLAPMFEAETGLSLEVQAVGTGAALALARAGEVDVVLTHSREAENRFVQEGYGVNWRQVMYNDFILVGPEDDPAGVRQQSDITAAFKAIAAEEATFLSRGDRSGTHLRELQLWEQAGIEPVEGGWYQSISAGMLEILRQASEQQAYTIVDRSTWFFHRHTLELAVVSEGDHRLQNVYSVMAVSPTKVEGARFEGAMAFLDFLVSPQAQLIIRDHGVGEFGRALYTPLALDR